MSDYPPYESRLTTLYGVFDEAGNWVPTDKDGNPRSPQPSTDERIAMALESIAASLEKIAHPVVTFVGR